jgi:hypothetical protein
MIDSKPESWSFSRRGVVAVAVALGGIVWTHGLAQLLRLLGPSDAPLAAGPLTLAAVFLAVMVAAVVPRYGFGAGALAGVVAAAAVQIVAPGSWAPALALPLMGGLLAVLGRWLGRSLPAGIDAAPRSRPLIAVVWALVAVAAVVQTGRLATWVTDPSSGFVLTTKNPFWHGHLCLPAYLYGAELAERGEANVYDAAHYPAVNPEAAPESRVEGMVVEDPYQYAPQFLLLPWAALKLSTDFDTLRILWFAIQCSLFVGVFTLLARWIGGRAGRLAMWSLPTVLAAFPVLHNFQFGQFHLPAVALAVAAMVAFEAGRRSTGGLMLAAAVLAKLFPVVLVVLLAVNRRFRDLTWTLAWIAAITLVTLAVFGPAPFVAFVDYHLPRLGSGEAFAFDEVWPEIADLVVADNQGVFGLARKAGLSKPTAAVVGRLFGIAVLGLAVLAGIRLRGSSRWAQGAVWLTLLGLGSLASPGAWGDYIPTVAVWLLALVVPWAVENRRWIAPLVVAALFEGLLLGTMPIGEWAPPAVMVPVSAMGVLIMLALFGSVLAGAPRRFAWSVSAEPRVEVEPLRRAA